MSTFELSRKETRNVTRRQLISLVTSTAVREIMIYNPTLDNLFLISKKSLLSTLKLEDELDEMLPSYSIEVSLGTLYVY